MSRFIAFHMTLKQAYIVKHALRDKLHRDEAEERLLQSITEQIDARKEELGIGVSKNAQSI